MYDTKKKLCSYKTQVLMLKSSLSSILSLMACPAPTALEIHYLCDTKTTYSICIALIVENYTQISPRAAD